MCSVQQVLGLLKLLRGAVEHGLHVCQIDNDVFDLVDQVVHDCPVHRQGDSQDLLGHLLNALGISSFLYTDTKTGQCDGGVFNKNDDTTYSLVCTVHSNIWTVMPLLLL